MTGRIVGIALVGAALLAPNALAADRTGTLAAIGDKFEWSDENNRFALGSEYAAPPPVFAMCDDPGWPCDTTLVNVTAPGQLDIEVHDTGLVRPDVDIYLYASDADGTVGDEIGRSETTAADEFISTVVEPGYYLLQVAYFSGAQNNSTGKATLNEIPPPEEEEDF